MWKSINGSHDENLLIAEVRILKSLGVGKISEPQNQGSWLNFKTS